MADEIKQAAMAQPAGTDEPDVTPEPQQADAGNAPNDADPKVQLEAMRTALRKANAEAVKFRKAAEAAAQAEEARKQAEMTEAEKLQSRLTKLEAEKAEASERIRNIAAKAAIERAARALNLREEAVKDAADLLAARGFEGLDVSDEGEVSGADEVLKAMVKARPFWAKTPEQQGSLDADKGQGAGKPPTDNEAYKRSLRQRFRI
jgi:hypothetical protein